LSHHRHSDFLSTKVLEKSYVAILRCSQKNNSLHIKYMPRYNFLFAPCLAYRTNIAALAA
ncbi:hypothetical protein, partial [Methylotenera sp.]|uniref:hypothetical protein n=1 Tax=Methylotenera sp. TaxID=2051956 RepID=UPI00273504BF